jgi:hypothetical protein
VPPSRNHRINVSQGVGALAPTFKDTQNRALAPEEILLYPVSAIYEMA